MPHRDHNFDRLTPRCAHRSDERGERSREITRAQKNDAARWNVHRHNPIAAALAARGLALLDSLPPPVLIELERLKVTIRQVAEHERDIEPLVQQRVCGDQHGSAGG